MKKIGIYGGGQLSRMLALAGHEMGVPISIYCQNMNEPAAQVCSQVYLGAANDEKKLELFFKNIDQLIFENEFLPEQTFKSLEKKYSQLFFPSLKSILTIQDKLNQKKILQKLNIASSDFLLLKNQNDFSSFLEGCQKKWGHAFVLKWSRLGYDGYGTLMHPLFNLDETFHFVQKAYQKNSQIYAEKKIKFLHELAMLSVYEKSKKQILHYPLVITQQNDGMCDSVLGPATEFGINQKLEKQAQKINTKIAKALQLQGSFAVEYFLDEKQKLYVNEIAPRVHNSAHYTQNASLTSQFSNHLLACLREKLGSSECKKFFFMKNILGPKNNSSQYQFQSGNTQTFIHYYQKQEIRPKRKLGHINILFDHKNEKDKVMQLANRIINKSFI